MKHSLKRKPLISLRIAGLLTSLMISPAFPIGILSLGNPECGIASTYSSGHITANGEPYNHMGISAAHKTLPFGTRVIVRNQRTGKSILLRINDRGPYIPGRIIDLSTGAKNKFGMGGLAPVCIDVVSYGNGKYVHTHKHHRKHHHHHKKIHRKPQI